MSFPPFGFTGAKSYDRRVFDEQVLLERWRKDMLVSDYLADLKGDLALTDAEWVTVRRELTCDGIEGLATKALRKIKQRIF